MSNWWTKGVAKGISEGKYPKSTFSIPNGTYLGDLFVVTDAKRKILKIFMWTGGEWVDENAVFDSGRRKYNKK